MRRIAPLFALLLSTTLLASCGGSPEDNKTTTTRMDDIDSLEGTISDDAINTDQSNEEAQIDPEAPAAKAAKPADKGADKDTSDDGSDDAPSAGGGKIERTAPTPQQKAGDSGE